MEAMPEIKGPKIYSRKEVCMTRKEAEAKARELNKREPQWFCPLINGPCNKDCVNFTPAFVESREKK